MIEQFKSWAKQAPTFLQQLNRMEDECRNQINQIEAEAEAQILEIKRETQVKVARLSQEKEHLSRIKKPLGLLGELAHLSEEVTPTIPPEAPPTVVPEEQEVDKAPPSKDIDGEQLLAMVLAEVEKQPGIAASQICERISDDDDGKGMRDRVYQTLNRLKTQGKIQHTFHGGYFPVGYKEPERELSPNEQELCSDALKCIADNKGLTAMEIVRKLCKPNKKVVAALNHLQEQGKIQVTECKFYPV